MSTPRPFTPPRVPVIAAPMAGGPSTWQLAAAVSAAGGTGFLAGGMCPVDRLVEDLKSARAALAGRSDAPRTDRSELPAVGVNLFVPEPANTALPAQRRAPDSPARRRRTSEVDRFRSSLLADAEVLDVELPGAETLDPDAMDGWEQKLDAAVAGVWPLVTFTFGLPSSEVFDRLHASGSVLGVTVTTAAEAVTAVEHGADLLTVQGPESGGHRSTHDPAAEPGTEDLVTLLGAVRAAVGPDLPLVAAGGIMSAEGVRRVLDAGAVAAQCGTAFLRAAEAGTTAVHRAALEAAAAGQAFTHDDGAARTAITRAFSGRWARGLENRFMREHPDAPAAYPEVNVLTGPIKRASAAAGDPESTNLWAGTGAARAREAPASQILRGLTPEAG